MAQLLVAGHGRVPDSLGAYLREALPDDQIVVADPVVSRREIAAIVVGPGGLVVVDAADSLLAGSDANGADAAVVQVVHAFLAAEFSALHLPVGYCRAVMSGPRVTSWVTSGLPAWRLVQPDGAPALGLAEAILAAPAPLDSPLADPAARMAVAVALRDCQITPSQRTTRPFVFRSGGTLLGGARQAWTIRAALEHIDRHPQDGVYHLRNRTLEHWLAAEGAAHLATLARTAGDRCFDDPRRGLEEFLIGSGLVVRAVLALQPPRLDLGYILAGESATGHFRISRPGGAGYLLGHLTTSDSCVSVYPSSFSGERVAVTVTVDTAGLLLQAAPCEAVVAVHSVAHAELQTIPVRFRVAPLPSRFSRFIGRPLIGLLAGALFGALIGGAWWLNAAPKLTVADRLLVGSPLFWLGLFSLLWAGMGVFRGLLQPAAWPSSYALLRWLYSVLIWSGALGVFGVTAVWLWYRGFLGDASLRPETMWIALHYGVALSILPATVQELLAAQRRSSVGLARPWQQVGRRLTWAVASAGLLLLLAAAPVFVRPAWERASQADTRRAAEQWAATGWAQATVAVNELLRQLYLYAYDRRAPITQGASRIFETPATPPGGR